MNPKQSKLKSRNIGAYRKSIHGALRLMIIWFDNREEFCECVDAAGGKVRERKRGRRIGAFYTLYFVVEGLYSRVLKRRIERRYCPLRNHTAHKAITYYFCGFLYLDSFNRNFTLVKNYIVLEQVFSHL